MKPHSPTYSLRNVPAEVWLAARARALQDHLSLRQVIITMLENYVKYGLPKGTDK